MDNICKICGQEFEKENHFWLEHHVSQATYYKTYYPRYSMLTGDIIQFKSKEFYLTTDFNDKNELKSWLKANPDKAIEYALNIIKKRKDEGKMKYVPTQVELRSLCAPNIVWYEKALDYNKACNKLGLLPRFDYNLSSLDLKINPNRIFTILVDTREQKPLDFTVLNIPTRNKPLSYGDYCAKGIDSTIFIERKSLPDFISTLCSGYDRFVREIERAKAKGHYLVIMVEAPILDALAFNRLPYISRNIKGTPDYVFHKVRKLLQDYPHIQFVFSDGRTKAAELIKTIYCMGYDARMVDLQYLLDKKII